MPAHLGAAPVTAGTVPAIGDLGAQEQSADDQQPVHVFTVAAAEVQERGDDEGDSRQDPHCFLLALPSRLTASCGELPIWLITVIADPVDRKSTRLNSSHL